jgi:hypothetical protein
MTSSRTRTFFVLLLAAGSLAAQKTPKITTPKEALGFNIGDDYMMANYTQLEVYWKKLATESDRMNLVDIGKTAEGRPQYMAIISSPENIKNLAKYKNIAQKLAHAEGVSEAEAHQLAHDGKAVVWIDGGLHANETVGSQQLMETVYQLVSRTDPETMRLLNDDIVLCVQANPDGQEIIANWYMREKDPMQRTLNGTPTLYNKYIGHDDNRDFYMSNMPESTNMNRQLSIEWFPLIVYNHHQTGPAGAVIFMPPFRDPFNYNLDPLVPLGIELVGTAMHSRLVAEGKGGSAMRSGSSYSTWWNGGLRTITYFHNQIGLLTEIIGSPTPMNIALVPDKQLPQGDWPLPIAPQVWRYRQSIDYEITNNYAVMDIASKYRETFLFNSWRMGMNSIERGSKDYWTITPKRIAALKAAGATPVAAGTEATAGGRGGAAAAAAAASAAQAPSPDAPSPDAAPGGGGGRGGGVSASLYNTVLHDPKLRDPRGYIIPSDQADFATATKFIDTLLKNGITVMKASAAFPVNGKAYPAGSYVVKTAQAFRPHILDMFEPQDHPNDFAYPGGPPNRPYDITGWTLAMQMGVQFDRVLDSFDGPFAKVPVNAEGLADPPAAPVSGPANPAGWLISHKQNDSFVVVNRLLKANCDVYWMDKDIENMGTGAVWVPASAAAKQIIAASAQKLGVGALGMATAPKGAAMKLKPIRIGLYDQYGGNMPAGWTRWILEQYEFPFQVVYPATLDAGDLKSKFDVLVFVDGAARMGANGGGRGGGGRGGGAPGDVPDEYKDRVGRISVEKTMPQIRKFIDSGGDVVTIGSSTSMAEVLGIPVTNYMTEMGSDGKEHPLSADKFYVPGSLLRMAVDNTNPLAFGMGDQVDVFFDSSPVFKMAPDAAQKKTNSVGWFAGSEVLDSGWAWGQQYLNGGTAVAEATVGEGKVVLLGPEVAFRAQPHGTFKFLFNGLYYGSATAIELK